MMNPLDGSSENQGNQKAEGGKLFTHRLGGTHRVLGNTLTGTCEPHMKGLRGTATWDQRITSFLLTSRRYGAHIFDQACFVLSQW